MDEDVFVDEDELSSCRRMCDGAAAVTAAKIHGEVRMAERLLDPLFVAVLTCFDGFVMLESSQVWGCLVYGCIATQVP